MEVGVRLLVQRGRLTVGMKNEEINEFAMLSIVHFAKGIPKKRFNIAGVCMISTIRHFIVALIEEKIMQVEVLEDHEI